MSCSGHNFCVQSQTVSYEKWCSCSGNKPIIGKLLVSFTILPVQALIIVREGIKKPIESVIMIIPGMGGGSSRGDHTLSGFFFLNAPNLVVWLH